MKFRRSYDKELLNRYEYDEIHSLVDVMAGFYLVGKRCRFYIEPWRSGWHDINSEVIYLDGSFDKWNMLKNKIMIILSLEELENS